jgi:cytoskeletal protein CcmA (bactofilin family)
MFSSNDKKTNADNDTNVGGSTKIYGNIHFSGKLQIDGEIVGNVVAEKDGSVLTISEGGKIEGNVQVHRIILNGEVIGDVHALSDIELAANARVRGNVYYDKIEMARGAEVNGNMIHGKPQAMESEPAPVENLGMNAGTANPVETAMHATVPVTNNVAATPPGAVAATAPVNNVVAAATPVANVAEPAQAISTQIQQPKIKIS